MKTGANTLEALKALPKLRPFDGLNIEEIRNSVTTLFTEENGQKICGYFAEKAKKLWKLLIDKDMKKKDLEKAAGISNYVISKMNKGENITVDIVGKICSALNCTPNDIMEFSDDSI